MLSQNCLATENLSLTSGVAVEMFVLFKNRIALIADISLSRILPSSLDQSFCSTSETLISSCSIICSLMKRLIGFELSNFNAKFLSTFSLDYSNHGIADVLHQYSTLSELPLISMQKYDYSQIQSAMLVTLQV